MVKGRARDDEVDEVDSWGLHCFLSVSVKSEYSKPRSHGLRAEGNGRERERGKKRCLYVRLEDCSCLVSLEVEGGGPIKPVTGLH